MDLRKVLVVEDSDLLHQMYELVLLRYRTRGAVVLHAHNGAEALQRLKSHPDTDLILLDLYMPVMSGLDFLRFRQEQESLRSIPVLVVTVRGQQDEVAMALAAGASGVLTKPLRTDVFHAEVDRLMEARSAL